MKRVFLTLCILSTISFVFGQQVDISTAKQVATTQFQAISDNTSPIIADVQTKYDNNGQAIYYAVNFQDGGFVVVAADERVNPIIAYSNQSRYEINKIAACESFVSAYENHIADERNVQATSPKEVTAKWANLKAGKICKETGADSPLMTSIWNQDKYYNWLCPDDAEAPYGYDNHVPNGCVALAMAQVMYYHRYPRTGYGSSSYSSDYGRLYANYGATNYDYESMADEAIGYSDAIARLIYHCGVSVQMAYAAGGSGSNISDALTAMRGRFLYAQTANLKVRDAYSDSEWLNLIKADIDNGCPIIYSAYNPQASHDAGHAFVCDGYNSTGYIHLNWGWGGQNNAYFSLSGMDGYVSSNKGLFNMKPRNDTSNFFTGTKTLTATYGSFNDGSGRIEYRNNTNCSWLISPGANTTRITLTVAKFSTELGNDIVNIYAGNSANGTLVKSISGDTITSGTSISITGSEAFITFTSNGSVTKQGFTFNYSVNRSMEGYCSGMVNPAKKTDNQGILTNGSGTNNYENTNTCYWSIAPSAAASKDAFGIIFREFNIGQGDMLEIMKQGSTTATATNMIFATKGQYRFSLDNMPTLDSIYTVNSKTAYIKFITDNNLTNKGWKIEWLSDLNIDEMESGFTAISVYPNPATSILNINIETKETESVKIDICDMLGRIVYSENFNNNQINTTVDVSNFAKGIYMVRMATNKGITTKKINIQ